jgi:transcriptional regulator with XRE-family HTH domain
MTKPDATLHNPAPAYLRGLVAATGLTQRECARRIGVSDRLLRYYLTDPASGKEAREAPYPVQYALEALAIRR